MVQFTGIVALVLAAQVGAISPGGVQAIGPKQDDPRAMCSPGGAEEIGPKQDDPRKLAIGPKQDDPRAPIKVGVLARPGDDNDPKASGGGGAEAIGPKQDDPRAPAQLGVVARPGDDNDPKARPTPAC